MKLQMGSQVFEDVTIPLLWGTRAVLQDGRGRLTVIDTGQPLARLEVVGDVPAPGVEYRPAVEGFIVMQGAADLYLFDATRHRIIPLGLDLPECEISSDQMRIGNSILRRNAIRGFGVGVLVTPGGGLALGAPIPPGLAPLEVA